jgi:hypothetical protein
MNHEEKCEGKQARDEHFLHLMLRCFLFSDFSVIYFFINATCVRKELRDFFYPIYKILCRCKYDSMMRAEIMVNSGFLMFHYMMFTCPITDINGRNRRKQILFRDVSELH